jgi:hypothetical protein
MQVPDQRDERLVALEQRDEPYRVGQVRRARRNAPAARGFDGDDAHGETMGRKG